MNKRNVSSEVRKQAVAQATTASARLERRDVPVGHVRSQSARDFVRSLRDDSQ